MTFNFYKPALRQQLNLVIICTDNTWPGFITLLHSVVSLVIQIYCTKRKTSHTPWWMKGTRERKREAGGGREVRQERLHTALTLKTWRRTTVQPPSPSGEHASGWTLPLLPLHPDQKKKWARGKCRALTSVILNNERESRQRKIRAEMDIKEGRLLKPFSINEETQR